MVKGSYDYIGLNHYTTSYFKSIDNVGTDWASDIHTESSKINSEGHFIGPQA